MMNARPQTLGYALADSPGGTLAFFYDKSTEWTYSGGEPERALTRDEMFDDVTLYWLTNTAGRARDPCTSRTTRRRERMGGSSP
jgi:hypothetical protein